MNLRTSIALLLALLTLPVQAATLGKELTPIGAERAANADGSIPSWSADELSDEDHLQWMADIC